MTSLDWLNEPALTTATSTAAAAEYNNLIEPAKLSIVINTTTPATQPVHSSTNITSPTPSTTSRNAVSPHVPKPSLKAVTPAHLSLEHPSTKAKANPYAHRSTCGVDVTRVKIQPPTKFSTTPLSSSESTSLTPSLAQPKQKPIKPYRHNAWYRRHGFHAPYNTLFVVQWFALITQTVLFYTFLLPILPTSTSSTVKITAISASTFLTCLVVFFSIRISLIDTMDRAVRTANEPRDLEYIRTLGVPVVEDNWDGGDFGRQDTTLYHTLREGPHRPALTRKCNICRVYVQQGTRHCKSCNKCVQGLDHHCKFLNTCIGEMNYRSFVILVLSSLLLAIFYSCWCLWALSLYIGNFDEFAQSATRTMPRLPSSISPHVGLCVVIFTLSVGVVALVAFLNLQGFHCRLWFMNMTTVEFVNRPRYNTGNVWRDPSPIKSRSIFNQCRKALKRARHRLWTGQTMTSSTEGVEMATTQNTL